MAPSPRAPRAPSQGEFDFAAAVPERDRIGRRHTGQAIAAVGDQHFAPQPGALESGERDAHHESLRLVRGDDDARDVAGYLAPEEAARDGLEARLDLVGDREFLALELAVTRGVAAGEGAAREESDGKRRPHPRAMPDLEVNPEQGGNE